MHELVPQSVYNAYSGSSRLWLCFDPLILRAGDLARERYGKMIANTWKWGGRHQYRGLRSWDCEVGAELSQHKFGRALDLVPVEAAPEEIRQDILKGSAPEIAELISCLEMDISWLHMDRGNRTANHESGLQLVYP